MCTPNYLDVPSVPFKQKNKQMKKALKRIALVLAIILFVVLTAISVALWFVFTPEKLTPIVRKQAAQFLTCKSEISSVELTFFSTFPRFGLKVNDFTLINPVNGAPSDTLVSIDELIGVVDVKAYWKNEDIVLNELRVCHGVINAFIDSLGKTNFDITPPDSAAVDTAQTQEPFKLNIESVELENINISYVDKQSKMLAEVKDLAVQLSGTMDSVNLKTDIDVANSIVTFVLDKEPYLNSAKIKLKIPSTVVLAKNLIEFGESEFSINDIDLFFNGIVEDDSTNKRMNIDIGYSTSKFPVQSLIALIPPAFQSYTEGMTIEGVASSDGKITGSYSASGMPLMDIHVALSDANITYSALPWPLSKASGDFVFYSDLTTDAITYFRINNFSANTPQSSFSTRGAITHLFSDINIDLTSETKGFKMAEIKPFIPEDMNIDIKGSVSGRVKTAFTMSQLDKMLLDKMKFSGSVTLANFDVLYDTIYMKTDRTDVDFALPNPNRNKFSPFLYAKVRTDNFEAGTIDGYKATLKNGTIVAETSDVMDSTRLPDITCTFDIEHLVASVDTINVDINMPKGKLVMLSEKGLNKVDEITLTYSNLALNAKAGLSTVKLDRTNLTANVLSFMKQPAIKLNCNAENFIAQMDGNSINLGKFSIQTDVINDTLQTDSLLQWIPKGSLSLVNGFISSSMLNSALVIPSVKMDFSPEEFIIKESKLIIDSSDFSLSGSITNLLSYYKGDSLLTGSFSFVSKRTDVLQLMSLTSGIGYEETDSIVEPAADTAAPSGPFMVPKGVDITLKTKIDRALFGTEIAKDITGEVRIKDGVLVLDDLVFTTPASKMELTAMYRTPRKNHIYAGFDYHMLNIQIEDLLKMVPDIDSIMPMLKSFKGTGEFHFAAETYLDSMYNPKKSTIRGVSSIKGNNLVLMDGETFTEIAKTLRFTKQAENKVDSLSAEFTIFKEEIDIYPFMVVMDRYKAVVAGRHNMDMSFNYNISLLESPLPIKICVDVSGTMEDLKVRPTKCEYGDLYRPTSRKLLQQKQMELRRIIRESLIKNVVTK